MVEICGPGVNVFWVTLSRVSVMEVTLVKVNVRLAMTVFGYIFVLYCIHLEITGDPCNFIGPLQCDLFANHTICAFFGTYLDNFSKEECIEEFRVEKNDLPFWQRPLEFHLFCVARRGPKFWPTCPKANMAK